MTSEAGGTGIVCRVLPDELSALGLAASFLSSAPSLREEPVGLLVPTIAGQIRRRHYAFAFRGNRIVGYIGWALCEADIATAWAEGRRAPLFEQCVNGEVVMVMTIAVAESNVLRHLVQHVRSLYPGRRYVGRRAGTTPRARAGRLRPMPDGGMPPG